MAVRSHAPVVAALALAFASLAASRVAAATSPDLWPEFALTAQTRLLAVEFDLLQRDQAWQADLSGGDSHEDDAAPAAAAPEPPKVWTFPYGQPKMRSTDGRFSFAVRALLQIDAGGYDQAEPGPIATDLRRAGPAIGASQSNVDLTHAGQLSDGAVIRRARLGFDGVAFGDWDYRLIVAVTSAGNSPPQLNEAWVQYSGFTAVRLRTGVFGAALGLDDQASASSMNFLERSLVEDVARDVAGGNGRVTAEVLAGGDHWLVSAAATGPRLFTLYGQGSAAALGPAGRIAVSPLHGSGWLVHLGLHGSFVEGAPTAVAPGADGAPAMSDFTVRFSNTPGLRLDQTKLIDTGKVPARSAYTEGLEFAAQKANFLLQSEYERFGVDRRDIDSSPDFSGYYVEALWMLIGEPRRYNLKTAAFDGPPVTRPFNWRAGTWGALEAGVRVSEIDLNYRPGAAETAPATDAIRGGEEQNLSVGLSWWPNPVVRFMFDYEHVWVDRLSPNALVFETPIGAQIGQSYSAFAVRSQFAF